VFRNFRRWTASSFCLIVPSVGLTSYESRRASGAPSSPGKRGDSAGIGRWCRGPSSRLPLSPVRTYQEPPEGTRSFVRQGAPPCPLPASPDRATRGLNGRREDTNSCGRGWSRSLLSVGGITDCQAELGRNLEKIPQQSSRELQRPVHCLRIEAGISEMRTDVPDLPN
jgi:hypothetical protein